MRTSLSITTGRTCFLWGMLLVYALARVSRLYADRIPALLIVVLHVVPPALFALAHGSALYRRKGILIFAALCVGCGTLAESIGLRTGFPFGHYYFTSVMGPKVFELPALLALAYLGIGYVAWILALLILGYSGKSLHGIRVLVLPMLASLIMVAWDLSMDPSWSMIDRAWIWQDGGAYFGVPVSNFLGWFLTAYCYYQAFTLYCKGKPMLAEPLQRGFWRMAILMYAVCALGNVLLLKLPMAPPVVTDAAGKQWLTADIVHCCVLMSLLVMAPFALLAWLRVSDLRSKRSPQ